MTKPGDEEAQPKERNVAAGFWGDCLTFAVGATVTIAIVTLDVIADWLMYRQVVAMDIPHVVDSLAHVSNGTSKELVVEMRNFYGNIPLVLLSACCASSAAYLLYFIWFCYMFRAERNFLKDKYDGVTRKGYHCHRFGGEIFLLLHVLFEDFFVSGVFFAIQVAVSCRFQLALGSVVFELALGTTLLSLGWKFAQLVWNSGCMGQRDDYQSGTALAVLRCCTLLVLVCAFTLVIWNTILLVGWKYRDYRGPSVHNTIMDKIEIDRWKRQDGVALLYMDASAPSSEPWQEGFPELGNPTVMNVVHMNELLRYDNQSIYIRRPCVMENANFTSFLLTAHQHWDTSDCTITFEFLPMLSHGYILYDYMYTLPNETGACINGYLQFFQPAIPWQRSSVEDSSALNALNALETPMTTSMTATTSSNVPTTSAYAIPSLNYTSNVNYTTFHTVLFLSSLWPGEPYVCSYDLLPASLLNDDEACEPRSMY